MGYSKKVLVSKCCMMGLCVVLLLVSLLGLSTQAQASIKYSCGQNKGWLPYTYRKDKGQGFTQYNHCGQKRNAVGIKKNRNYRYMYPVPARSKICKNIPYQVNYYLHGRLYKSGGMEYGTKTGSNWRPGQASRCNTQTFTQVNECPGQNRRVRGVKICDIDQDRVTDAKDRCPSTPRGHSVNSQGCAQVQLDTDKDKINNAKDRCPSTPRGHSVNSQGCAAVQIDTDKDGVNNAADRCPSTPANSSVNAQGCASSQLDADKDGVSDSIDQCPLTPAGSSVNSQGCALTQLDTDEDGVNDALDQCPGSSAGIEVNENGCKVEENDFDGDGILNDVDAYPYQHNSQCTL